MSSSMYFEFEVTSNIACYLGQGDWSFLLGHPAGFVNLWYVCGPFKASGRSTHLFRLQFDRGAIFVKQTIPNHKPSLLL
jgi:hypothetical protein